MAGSDVDGWLEDGVVLSPNTDGIVSPFAGFVVWMAAYLLLLTVKVITEPGVAYSRWGCVFH